MSFHRFSVHSEVCWAFHSVDIQGFSPSFVDEMNDAGGSTIKSSLSRSPLSTLGGRDNISAA
jgi:hypothetical protein